MKAEDDSGPGRGLDAFKSPGFAAYWAVLVTSGFAMQIQTVEELREHVALARVVELQRAAVDGLSGFSS